jgi:hypothetical protein
MNDTEQDKDHTKRSLVLRRLSNLVERLNELERENEENLAALLEDARSRLARGEYGDEHELHRLSNLIEKCETLEREIEAQRLDVRRIARSLKDE